MAGKAAEKKVSQHSRPSIVPLSLWRAETLDISVKIDRVSVRHSRWFESRAVEKKREEAATRLYSLLRYLHSVGRARHGMLNRLKKSVF